MREQFVEEKKNMAKPNQQKGKNMKYKNLYSELRAKVLIDFGSPCKYFQYGCPICDAYLMLSILGNLVDLEGMDLGMAIVKKAIH